MAGAQNIKKGNEVFGVHEFFFKLVHRKLSCFNRQANPNSTPPNNANLTATSKQQRKCSVRVVCKTNCEVEFDALTRNQIFFRA